jgi:tRNA (mo5U34)-methyltransferase
MNTKIQGDLSMAEQGNKFSEQYIKERIASVPCWWHQIEVAPGICTPGKDITQARVEGMHLPKNMEGKRVLDIGAYEGFFTFECERRGGDITAMDVIGPSQSGFSVAHELIRSTARHVQQSVYNLHPEKIGQFDIVLFLGVFYHLRHPLLALDRIYSVCKDLLILESQICDHCFIDQNGHPRSLSSLSPDLEKLPIAQFYPYDELNGDPSNWWSPNLIALEKIIETSGFEPELVFSNGVRVVFHCKKKSKRPPWVEQEVKTIEDELLPDVLERTSR